MSLFSTARSIKTEIRAAITAGVRACGRHRAVFAYLVGNEIPPDMIRWHGADAVRRVPAASSSTLVKRRASRERWSATPIFRRPNISTIDFTDFVCFNVYLHDEGAFRRYIARLHNLAVDKPLVLTEFGVDSMRNGEDEQATILSWQVHAAFASGVAGTFVFAWTDEWFTGGHLIEDWAFGLVDRDRQPKPAFRRGGAAVQRPAAAAAAALSARLGRGLRLQRRAHDGGVPRLARSAELSRLRGHRRQ